MDYCSKHGRVDLIGNFGWNQGAVREQFKKDLQNTCGGSLVTAEHPIRTRTRVRAVAFEPSVTL